MNHRTSRKSLQALGALGLFSVVAGSACGGRAVTIDDGNSPGTSAGSSALGGASPAGGASGHPNGGTGAVIGRGGGASAGSPNGGGGNACGDVPCPPIACGPSSSLVFPNGACCPACVSNCVDQVCAGVACGAGFHLEMQASACCPTCVADPLDCVTGQKNYLTERSALTDKYKYGCTTGADCTVVTISNACESACSYALISKSNLDNLTTNLNGAAAMDCASCPPSMGPVPPCAPPGSLTCSFGQCAFDAAP